MRSIKRTLLVILFICTVAVSGAFAQEATPTPAASPSPPAVKEVPKAVGAYRTVSQRNPDVRAAYAFAIKSQAAKEAKPFAFVRVLKAESQVVAGINYRICMLVREGKGRSKSVTAVVNKDLKKVWTLTSWVPGGCKQV
ncbi:MAG: hypothetical protein H0X08_04880 [Blastocatellia bacterium]|nr:hypothetical protein [Blastocatellia bacterium]